MKDPHGPLDPLEPLDDEAPQLEAFGRVVIVEAGRPDPEPRAHTVNDPVSGFSVAVTHEDADSVVAHVIRHGRGAETPWRTIERLVRERDEARAALDATTIATGRAQGEAAGWRYRAKEAERWRSIAIQNERMANHAMAVGHAECERLRQALALADCAMALGESIANDAEAEAVARVRHENRALALETALRALVATLPKCDSPGCSQPATWIGWAPPHESNPERCEAHGPQTAAERLEWCELRSALATVSADTVRRALAALEGR